MKMIVLAAALLSAPSYAAINVDGVLDGAYGAATGQVGYDAAAPEGNFGAPTSKSNSIGYRVWLSADSSNVYGFLQTEGPGASAGAFANLYFDVHPGNGTDADIMFEITNQRGKILGQPFMYVPITYVANANVIEFSIPKAYFGADGNLASLRLSQSFGYSVAGGPKYGPNTLGAVVVGGAVPEPATWGMMLLGFGVLGAAMRRQRQAAVSFA